MESKTVHFSVDPNWATDFVRARWGEGEFQWCYEFLEACGVQDFQIAKQIIWGDSRFAQDDEDPNCFVLEDDDWRADPDEHHLCQYPNPFVFSELRDAQEKITNHKAEMMSSLLYRDFNEERDQAERRGKAYPYVTSRKIDAVVGSSDFMAFSERVLREQFLNEDIANSETVEPSDIFENGIITPDGKFYRCGVMGHNELAAKLGYAVDHETLDYNSDGNDPASRAVIAGCFVLSLTFNAKKIRRPEKPTKAQLKKLGEWYGYVAYSDAPVMEFRN